MAKARAKAREVEGIVEQRPDDAEPGTAIGADTVVEPPEDHVAAFEKQVERLQQTALDAVFESGTLVGDIRDVLMDIFKNRPKPWSAMSESEQRDVAKALENAAKKVIKKVVVVVAEQDEISVMATVKGYSAKGGVFKINAEARGDEETATQLFGMDGHDVVIMSADAARFVGQRRDADIQPDAPALDLQPPGDEVDLEAAAETEAEEQVSTLAEGESVNLKTGMVERAISSDVGDGTEDVREATPDELAAERNRQADFSDDEPETENAEGTVDA